MRKRFLLFILAFVSTQIHAKRLDSSILMFGESSYRSCKKQVDKAIRYEHKFLQFVPSLHYSLDQNKNLSHYCWVTNQHQCEKVDQQLLERFYNSLDNCIAYTISKGITPYFLPHLDDGENALVWRNLLDFDPLKKYQGHSYYEIMIRPIVQILNKYKNELRDSPYLALQGEMGRSTALYPHKYLAIYQDLKQNFSFIQVGLELNFNSVLGKANYFKILMKRHFLSELIDKVDFIGISAYHPLSVDLVESDFDKNIQSVEGELQRYLVSIPEGKPIHFSEIGLGGGSKDNNGQNPATSVDEVASNPWSGMFYQYSVERDPWQHNELKEYRRKFHDTLLLYLNNASKRSKHPVTQGFLWSVSSWDPLSISHDHDGYFDDYIAEKIVNHNN